MKNYALLISYVFLSFCGFSQQAPLDVFSSIGGNGIDKANSITIDSDKNIYLSGVFSGNVDFNPGVDSFFLNSNGETDVFILKLNNKGEFIWAKSFGGKTSEICNSIILDNAGNVLTTGSYNGRVDFNPNIDSFIMTSHNNSSDIFIHKLNKDGEFLWAKTIGGPGKQEGRSIDTDSQGNVYTTGYFEISADFDPNSNTAILYSIGSNDIYISKLDSNGNYKWAKRIGGYLTDEGKSIKFDNYDGIYITGFFQSTVNFDQNVILTSNNNSHDIFILRLDTVGNFKWVKNYGGSMPDYGESIDTDIYGNGYCTGSFYGFVEFDSDTGKTMLKGYATDVFILKIDTRGTAKYLKQFGGYVQEGHSLSVANNMNLVISGRYVEDINFNIANSKNVLKSDINDNAEVFIANLDSKGDFIWSKSIGGNDDQINTAITVDNEGTVYSTGYFKNIARFVQYSDSFILQSKGNTDLYFQKLKLCKQSKDSVSIFTCNCFISPSHKKVWKSTGIYIDTIMNFSGCDSIITCNLTITSLNKTVTIDSKSLKSNDDNAVFQWLNCDSSFKPILGQTNQNFAPPKSGNYAVQINRNGCTDTSECFNFTHSNLESIAFDFFQISPNPNYGNFTIRFNEFWGAFNMIISNDLGQIITKKHYENNSSIGIELLIPGVYFIEVTNSSGNRYIKKLIVF